MFGELWLFMRCCGRCIIAAWRTARDHERWCREIDKITGGLDEWRTHTKEKERIARLYKERFGPRDNANP